MYINHFRRLPKDIYVAFSGGVDSCVLVHSILARGTKPTLVFYHHGNEFADVEENFVRQFAETNNLPVLVSERCTKSITGSKEKFWRDQRFRFFKSLPGTVAVGQHLSDAAEWYLLSALRGNPDIYSYKNENTVKPLLLYDKGFIEKYARHHNLNWLQDTSNTDKNFCSRNRIRTTILPECLKVHPGFLTVVKNLIVDKNAISCNIPEEPLQ